MSHEIVYTSAPHGLDPGSQGYCTVESTRGIPKLLLESLESLSGYRHAFGPQDPRASKNPVNYSHLILRLGGRKYRVLSRVSDAERDYSGRDNKLANHVALEPQESVPGGPAWALADPDFCVTRWSGTPGWLPAGRLPRRDDCPLKICSAWQAAAGDAGWAGVLAASAQENDGRPMYVIYPPGETAPTDTLSLVVEALGLLPSDLRWETTFNTYFTKLPAGIDCKWRFVLDGSEEAATARKSAPTRVIDLCRAPLGKADDGELVFAARNGRLAETRAASPSSRTAVRTTSVAATSTAPGLPRSTGDVSSPPVRPIQFAAATQAKSRRRRHLTIGLAAATVLIAVGIGSIWFVKQRGAGTATGDGTAQQSVETEFERKKREEKERRAAKKARENEAKEAAAVAETKPAEDKQPGGPADDGSATVAAKTDDAPPPEIKPLPEPLRDIIKRKGVLELPPPMTDTGITSEPRQLAQIFVRQASECQLKFAVTGNEPEKNLSRFDLKITNDTDQNERTWNVTRKADNGISTAAEHVLGTFTLKDQWLSFAWNQDVDRSLQPGKLLHLQLSVEAGKEHANCALSQPVKTAAPKLEFIGKQQIPLPFLSGSVTDPARISVDLKITIPDLPPVDLHDIRDDSKGKRLQVFKIPHEAPHGNGTVEVGVALQMKENQQEKGIWEGTLSLEQFVHKTRTVSQNDLRIVGDRVPYSHTQIEADRKKNLSFAVKQRNVDEQLRTGQEVIKTGIAKFEQDIKDLQTQNEDGSKNGLIKLKSERIAGSRTEIARLDDIRTIHQSAAKMADGNVKWCDDMEKFFQKLRYEARIEFEVFLDLGEGRRSVLLKSASGDLSATSVSLPETTPETTPESSPETDSKPNPETKPDSKPSDQ